MDYDSVRAKELLTGKIDLKAKTEAFLKNARMSYTLTVYDDDDDNLMLEVNGTNYIVGCYSPGVYYLQETIHIAGTRYDPPDTDLKNILESTDFYEIMRELSKCLINETIQDMKERDYYEDSH